MNKQSPSPSSWRRTATHLKWVADLIVDALEEGETISSITSTRTATHEPDPTDRLPTDRHDQRLGEQILATFREEQPFFDELCLAYDQCQAELDNRGLW